MNTNRVSISNRLISKVIVFFMVATVFASGFILFPIEVQAASGSLKVTSAKWTNKSIDTTTKFNVVLKLKIKVKNTVSGSNKLEVTVRNSKTKKKISTYIGKNGGTARFSLTGNNLKAGTWKLFSVSAVKRSSSGSKWNSNTGRWEPTYQNKKLKTVNRTKPSVKITRGVDTKLTLSMSSSVPADLKTVPISATLKTAKGKAVSGAKVTFLIANYKNNDPLNQNVKTTKATGTTNAKGVATVNVNVPRLPQGSYTTELYGFAVAAQYTGKAKSYVASKSSVKGISQPKIKTRIVGTPVREGNKLKIKLETTDGRAVVGFPLVWQITGNRESTQYDITNAQGYSYADLDTYTGFSGNVNIKVGDTGKIVDFNIVANSQAPYYIYPDIKSFNNFLL